MDICTGAGDTLFVKGFIAWPCVLSPAAAGPGGRMARPTTQRIRRPNGAKNLDKDVDLEISKTQ